MNKFAVAGVEVSADVLVVALDNGQLRSSEFPNTAAGHQQLLRWLGKQAAQVRLCMESTGLYGLDAALVLAATARSRDHGGQSTFGASLWLCHDAAQQN